jgi:peptide/nickel transport system substrate-binding protein
MMRIRELSTKTGPSWWGRHAPPPFAEVNSAKLPPTRRLSTVFARIARFPTTLSAALVAVALTGGVSGCNRPSDDDGGLPRAETLYVAGRQWGEPTTFNPLQSSVQWPVNTINLMYETLLTYNPLTGKMEPLLAESFAQNDDNVEVTLNPAARWSDGKPVTGWDVKYSFDLGDKNRGLPMGPVWQHITAVRLLDAAGKEVADTPSATPDYPRRIAFMLNKEGANPLVVLDSLQDIRVVPRHVFEPSIQKIGLEATTNLKFDKEPVISGPYQLRQYSSEKIVTERRPDYWGIKAVHDGKLPVPRYVVHPIYKSNDHFSIALRQGRLDMSSTFVPRIWRKAEKGVHAWLDGAPYFAASAMPMLFINVKHSALADPAYRRAMAFSVNYTDIRELAGSNYSAPLQPGLILPFGLEAPFYSAEDAKQYGVSYDPARAKQTLAEAGYTSVFNAAGDLVETRGRDGQRVPTVYIKSPTGWSDWEAIVKIAVRGMREAGIDAREKFVDGNLFWNDLFKGDFDLIMNTPASPPSPSKPWSRFEAIMTTKDFAPEGEKIYKNMGRFNDPKAPGYIARIDQLLASIPNMKDVAERVSAYRELNVIFMQQQPTIPLMYRPDQFYEFSTRHWTNYATGKNPYLPPQIPGERCGTRMLWSLKPVAQN